MFQDKLERKKVFLDNKINKFKKSRKGIFLKGLVHGCGQKLAIFQFFILGKIRQENDFYDILERKNAFLGYNNKKLKNVEKLTFFQRG